MATVNGSNQRLLATPAEPISYYLFNDNGDDEIGNYPITSFTTTFTENRNGKPNSASDFSSVSSVIKVPIQTINDTYDLTISLWVKIRLLSITYIQIISIYKQGVSDNFLLISFEAMILDFVNNNGNQYDDWVTPIE